MLDFLPKKLYDIDRDSVGLFFDYAKNIPTKAKKQRRNLNFKRRIHNEKI